MSLPRGRFPARRSRTLDWLIDHGTKTYYGDDIFLGFCRSLLEDGVPIDRASIQLRTLHPQFVGARFLWRPDLNEVDFLTLTPESLKLDAFRNSPVHALWQGAEGVRQRLDLPQTTGTEYGIYGELRAQGFTDYVGLPLQTSEGRRHSLSIATKRAGGFSTAELNLISDLLPLLIVTLQVPFNRRITKNVLNAYVGPYAGERILSGEIRRGSGESVSAVIWNTDIRGFTQLSELWPRDDVIAMLNQYFDIMCEPVERLGGEILKFVGDGMLAVFALREADACGRALAAARTARDGMSVWNAQRRAAGQFELGFGLALHIGEVMYGNIGSATRLDFTVIGPAVNVAARLQTLCRELDRDVLATQSFIDCCDPKPEDLEPVGRYAVRGVHEALEVHALREVRA